MTYVSAYCDHYSPADKLGGSSVIGGLFSILLAALSRISHFFSYFAIITFSLTVVVFFIAVIMKCTEEEVIASDDVIFLMNHGHSKEDSEAAIRDLDSLRGL